ncbi:type VII secretion protein EccB [Demequina aurantiaca]|uniref:type VII secretion protein EccB n=1 Tax=Demequina aurantiaca TaxID=676200 RepID=UPI000782F731|nr:type VII secretion protein EccB [Demequina aurantiaca]
MASKKDLIDAQSFSRRRLLTAFTAGAPGGKELEPAKPMRAVVAGIALAALVLVAGIFYGLLKPGLPPNWETNALILVSDSGARYFSSNGTLYPAINSTSARLLAPGGELNVLGTDSGSLDGIPIGPTVGIVGAPDDVPAAENLINSGWVACPVGDGTAVDLAGNADPAPQGAGTVVASDGMTYVIAGSHRYAVSPDAPDNVSSVLREVGLADQVALEVDSRWLNLFAAGDDLDPLTIAGAGNPAPGTDLLVGQVISQDATEARYLVTPEGTLAPLTPLAYRLYLMGTGALLGEAVEVSSSDTIGIETDPESDYGSDWPAEVLTELPADALPCALLDAQGGGVSGSILATASTVPDSATVSVPARGGALVLAGGEGDESVSGYVLVDELGTAYAIPASAGDDAPGIDDVLLRLGYTTDDAGQATSAWMQFFAAGPDLTVEAARRTPQGVPAVTDQPSPDSSTQPSEGEAEAAASATTASAAVPRSLARGRSFVADSTVQACEAGVEQFVDERPPALSMLQAMEASALATGEGVTVAVVDSGIDADNEHLRGVVVDGINLVSDGEDARGMTDVFGHGTQVAGIIAAQSVPGSGVVGVAPDVTLLSVRVFRGTDDDSIAAGYDATPARMAEGIRWAVDKGADIINVSLSDTGDDSGVREAVAYADARGALVVASAGNRQTATSELDGPRYPAAYPAALAVTAVDAAGNGTSDSIHGSHVELAAPGQDVLTAMSTGGDCMYANDKPSSSYATAYASGAAALVADTHAGETPAQWQYRLMASATRGNPDVRSDVVGWGNVQPYDALVMVPGSGERGPANPFTGQSGLTVDAPTVALVPHQTESPFVQSQTMFVVVTLAAAVLLATLATVLVVRRQADVVAPKVDQGDGMLDQIKGASTRITPEG